MRLSALAAVLLYTCSLSAQAARVESRETSIADIRQYQAQLAEQIDDGRLKTIPKATKDALRTRSDALSVLLDSPTAASNETELAKIGEDFFKLQNAAEKAALQVVKCRRVAGVSSRLAKRECRTVEDIQADQDFARKELENNNWNNIPPTGE